MKSVLILMQIFAIFIISISAAFASEKGIKVDLSRIRAIAEQRLNQLVGQPLNGLGIYFQDGVSAMRNPVVGDLAALIYLAELPKPLDGLYKIGLVIGLDGSTHFSLIEDLNDGTGSKKFRYASATNGTVIIKDDTPLAEITSLGEDVRKNLGQDIEIKVLARLGMITFKTSTLSQWIKALGLFVAANKIVSKVQLDYARYASPYELEPVKYLGDGLKNEWVNVDELRGVSAKMRREGKLWHHEGTTIECEFLLQDT